MSGIEIACAVGWFIALAVTWQLLLTNRTVNRLVGRIHELAAHRRDLELGREQLNQQLDQFRDLAERNKVRYDSIVRIMRRRALAQTRQATRKTKSP